MSTPASSASEQLPGRRRSGASLKAQLWYIVWFSALYLPVTAWIAAHRYLWNDELFTFYISAQPFRQIWTVLLTGVDQQPPPFYWFTHEAMRLIGPSPLAVRLASIAGFWLFCVCTISIVSRRAPAAYGFVAAMLAAVSGAYPYAYEGRPYAVAMGLAAAALLCWQRLDERKGFPFLMALSLALALCMHYYAVLVFVPLAVAELLFWRATRRLRVRAWLAFAAGVASLLAWLPVIRAAGRENQDFWARPDFFSVANYFELIVGPAALPWGVLAICAAAAVASKRSKEQADGLLDVGVDVPAAVFFTTLPLLAALIGALVTRAFTPRYALAGTIGICVLGGWLLAWAFRGRVRSAIFAGIFLSAYFLASSIAASDSIVNVANRAPVIWMIRQYASESMPVAIANPHMFFELSHQAPPDLKNRFFYIAEPELAGRFLKTAHIDRGVAGMQPWADLRVRRLGDVLSSGSPFLVFGYPGPWAWLVPELSSRKIPMSVAGSLGPDVLLRVLSNEPAASDRK